LKEKIINSLLSDREGWENFPFFKRKSQKRKSEILPCKAKARNYFYVVKIESEILSLLETESRNFSLWWNYKARSSLLGEKEKP
jgi:hypothetical protein